jgi:Flp pilus assembly protein TadG
MRNLMPRARRARALLLGRLARSGERGAIGVLVAVLISGGVLFGIGALVIDTGQLYQNRAELQNGADAGALAVAKSCATGTCAPSLAAQYATGNASQLTGGAAAVGLVCGSGSLGACPASTAAIYNCPANPPAGTNYVDVNTATLLSNGSTLLPPEFAGTLLGNGAYKGSTVKACAQAEWGAPSTATVVAVTMSACTWNQETNNGTSFAPAPPYPPNPRPASSFDKVIQLHGDSFDSTCPTGPAGSVAPGNFGWANDPTGNCTVTVSAGNTYQGKSGNSASNDCKTVLANAFSAGSVIYIPVYASFSGTGSNVEYTLDGFAAFVVTGYRVPSVKQPDWLNPANTCTGSNDCIDGYFTQGLIPDASGSGTNLGATIVKLTG